MKKIEKPLKMLHFTNLAIFLALFFTLLMAKYQKNGRTNFHFIFEELSDEKKKN